MKFIVSLLFLVALVGQKQTSAKSVSSSLSNLGNEIGQDASELGHELGDEGTDFGHQASNSAINFGHQVSQEAEQIGSDEIGSLEKEVQSSVFFL
ncbi:uncharacterized protein LOC117896055 [Drosophila subobscura]|uniref:uncharacterized protein LOC117896055 n=1 Tax=Drosophila subobscura TaxID=7241 RepID=UPI00155B1263|nr:uncharacterized protein LOC117896055 [Drosophila subobscura]